MNVEKRRKLFFSFFFVFDKSYRKEIKSLIKKIAIGKIVIGKKRII